MDVIVIKINKNDPLIADINKFLHQDTCCIRNDEEIEGLLEEKYKKELLLFLKQHDIKYRYNR